MTWPHGHIFWPGPEMKTDAWDLTRRTLRIGALGKMGTYMVPGARGPSKP